jgi:predicted nucleic acid-binding protein
MQRQDPQERQVRPKLFLDSSVLFAGVASATGAARALLLLGEAQAVTIVVSEQVLVETERALARKAPNAVRAFLSAVQEANVTSAADPTPEAVAAQMGIIADPSDVPIVVAAMEARADFLVTLDRRHFIDDPRVAARSRLRIGTPGDVLAWVRTQLA